MCPLVDLTTFVNDGLLYLVLCEALHFVSAFLVALPVSWLMMTISQRMYLRWSGRGFRRTSWALGLVVICTALTVYCLGVWVHLLADYYSLGF